jgi:hypothetical protein
VNVSNGSQEVTITANWKDDLSGVKWPQFSVRSPSGNQSYYGGFEKESGTANDGIYTGKVVIPRYSEVGEWKLTVEASDETGNWRQYVEGSQWSGSTPFPASITQKTINVASSLSDTVAPELLSLSLSASAVNVSNGSQEVTITANWKDDLSGVKWPQFSVRSLSGNQSYYGGFEKESGTANDGIYTGKVVIPRYSEVGEWKLTVEASDETGNWRQYVEGSQWSGSTPFPASITQKTIHVSLQVDSFINQYAPWPVALNLDKTSLDITSGNQTVKVRININNDDLPAQISASVYFTLPNNYGNGNSFQCSDFKLVSGKIANGIYEGTIMVPRYTKTGNYTLSSISISEYNGSNDSKNFNRWGESIPAELRKTIIVTGTQDVTAPSLQGLTVSPTSADTRNGSVSVTANLTIFDDLSGLNEAKYSRSGALALRSPSGKEFAWSNFNLGDRISGTSTNGTYQVQFEIPQYSEEGAWTIDYIELIDRNYNTRFLIPANLTAQQIAASTIQVQGWPHGWEQQSFTSADFTKGNATIQLSNLSFTYDDKEKVPTVATNPGNLTQNVTLTYNGATTSPIDPGTYTVVAFMNHPDYKGRQVATMTISNPPPLPQAPAPAPAPGGGAPSGGGGGGEPEKPKKGKKGSDKNDGGDKKSSSKKSDKKDNNDNKSAGKKSEKKSSSGGGDSNKSGGKKAKKK